MAGSAQRRVVEPPPPRSAERERLAEAVAAHLANVDRLTRLRRALDEARRDSVDAFVAVEKAADAVKTAAREEPRRAAAGALGEAYEGTGPSLEVAEQNLARARGQHQHLREVAAVLEKEIVAMNERLASTLAARQVAVQAVLDSDPAIDQLLAEYDGARAWVECLAEAIRAIGLIRLPRRYQNWDASNRPLPTVEPVAGQWKAALARLEAGEVDLALPTLD